MPSTTNKKKFERTGEEKYEKLAIYEKGLCWYYYKSLRTNGEQGFDPDKNDHKECWQASGTVKSYIKWADF